MNARNPTRREAQELSIVNDFKSRDRAIRAIESSSIDITARYIGIAMLMMMWPVTDGDLCKAIDEIAKAANVSKSTVLRHLPELYDAGFVVAEHGTGGKKSRYTFPLGVNSDTELDHELVVNGDTKPDAGSDEKDTLSVNVDTELGVAADTNKETSLETVHSLEEVHNHKTSPCVESVSSLSNTESEDSPVSTEPEISGSAPVGASIKIVSSQPYVSSQPVSSSTDDEPVIDPYIDRPPIDWDTIATKGRREEREAFEQLTNNQNEEVA